MKPSQPSLQHGASLTEVLVAITIFSVGLLGLLGVHATAMSHLGDSKYRADAALLADRLINDIWVNRDNAALYAYYGTTTTAPSTGGGTTGGTTGGTGGTTETTTALPTTGTEVAGAVGAWLADVRSVLPGGDARVAVAGSTVTVTVTWRPASGQTHQHVAVTTVQGP